MWILADYRFANFYTATIRESWEDAVFGQAGRMAFYQFLAIFPALLIVHMAAKHVLGSDVQHSFTEAANRSFRANVVDTIQSVLENFNNVQLPGWRLLTSLAGTFWAGCNGTWAMIYGLNAAYEVRESRSARDLATTIIGLTIVLAFITSFAVSIVAALASLRSRISVPLPLGLVESLVLEAVLLFWFSILYRFAPSMKNKRWQWSTPGALLAVTLWMSATLGTRLYFEAHGQLSHLFRAAERRRYVVALALYHQWSDSDRR